MIRSIFLLVAVATLPVGPVLTRSANAADVCGGCKATEGCQSCCEGCRLVCSPECKTVKEKKHGWDVECEPVCIPKVKCPLFNFFGFGSSKSAGCENCGDKSCNGNCDGRCQQVACGRIRTVHKLKKVEYETEKTVVEWKVKRCAIDCGKCGGGCAPLGCCGPGGH